MIPILYSFRRCPYAIRARLALEVNAVEYLHREVLLRDKPAEMLAISPKGTVPVLQVGERIIDESIDIMRWAFEEHSLKDELEHPFVERNDSEFKYFLDRYKYFDRYPEHPQEYYLHQALAFLEEIEGAFSIDEQGAWYLGARPNSPLNYAILPFVRQFAMVDKKVFDGLGYRKLARWLDDFLASETFRLVMTKKPLWSAQLDS